MATAAQHHPHEEAADVMAQILDGFTEYVQRADSQIKGGKRYRLSLLWVHSFAALIMAPAFNALGEDGMVGGTWFYLRLLPGMPTTLALILAIGGLVLGIGCVLRHRTWEAVGVSFLALFYVTMAIGFGLSVLAYYTGDLPGTKPATYAPILYFHITIIMIVHFGTLTKMILLGNRKD